jgi:hypothetical protein
MNKSYLFKNTLLVSLVLLACFWATTSVAETTGNFSVEILDVDPVAHTSLAFEEKLFVRMEYESEVPLRFQAKGVRNGSALDVGSINNFGLLHPPGKGEALAWVMFLNPTHIDAVTVSVYTEEWQRLFHLSREVDITWVEQSLATERVEPEWVKPLDRAEKRLTDIFYDPAPRRFGAIYDVFFYINLGAIPVYILVQLFMLIRYRYRWRELASIPLIPYLIAIFYLIVGLDMERGLMISFLFRYTFVALLWLLLVWLARHYWQGKLPPPKLYKPPKD